ncbi:hypothetical protein MLD38_029286 [Melastoma candidum]|uniref:Uncharacterized protein n=1 Tax=Melastoma candidum TaxID=119954 RepID=A0ACB9N552_9MYRT|nr:hypothetical protein MLD38_029286 [Melastoma candidum]
MALRTILIPCLGIPSNRFQPARSIRSGFRVRATIQQAPRGVAVEDDSKRRSANWPVNFWDHKFVASLGTDESHVEQINELKDEVKGMINDRESGTLDKLEFIDTVQRLGLGYHFETEIKDALGLIRDAHTNGTITEFFDLHSTALMFRLLRQHGFHIQQEVFKRFLKNDDFGGMLDEDDLVKGALSLYEASFHGIKGEFIMDDAKIVALNHLKSHDLEKFKTSSHNLARKVERALDMPLRWRSNRSEARWFIDINKQDPAMQQSLLQLAKLDYNFVQSLNRTEVVEMLRWWSELGVDRHEVLRDRPMESYLWANIMAFEPRLGPYRVATAKAAFLLTIMDDIYDIFGTVEELELLTDFINRWDISEIDRLPPVIRSTYLALYNSANEIAYQVMRDRGVNIIPFFKKMWASTCRGHLQEARRYNSGSAPTYEEYIDIAVDSYGGYVMMFTFFIGMASCLDKESMDFACNIPPILYSSSVVGRLTNDLSTSPYELARGDNFKSIQCYKKQHGVSEEEARKAIWGKVEEAWKEMNQQEFEEYPSFVPKDFLHAVMGFARSSHFFYHYGDGHALSDKETKDYLTSLVVEPVSI